MPPMDAPHEMPPMPLWMHTGSSGMPPMPPMDAPPASEMPPMPPMDAPPAPLKCLQCLLWMRHRPSKSTNASYGRHRLSQNAAHASYGWPPAPPRNATNGRRT